MMAVDLEKVVRNLEDVHEIENILGRYQYFHMGGGPPMGMSDCFVQYTDGGSLTCPMGTWEGIEGLRKWFRRGEPIREASPDEPVHFMLFPSTTIVVEVAEDGESARAMLTTPGYSGGIAPGGDGQPLSNWFYLKAAYDFVKEDGQWKAYNYHMWEIFQSDYHRCFTKGRLRVDQPDFPLKPDRVNPPEFLYSPTMVQKMVAVPPEPYHSLADVEPY